MSTFYLTLTCVRSSVIFISFFVALAFLLGNTSASADAEKSARADAEKSARADAEKLAEKSAHNSGTTEQTWQSFPVCHSFDCVTREVVSLSGRQWQEVSGWLTTPAKNAADERENIRKAVGWMEHVVGLHTPTHRDEGRNLSETAQQPGQLDCIDESKNTTTYLRLFEQYALLKWHRVIERAYRRGIVDQHWSSQIEEIESGQRWVVDSWFQDNGYLPLMSPSEEWKLVPLFGSAISQFRNRTEIRLSPQKVATQTSTNKDANSRRRSITSHKTPAHNRPKHNNALLVIRERVKSNNSSSQPVLP